MEGLNRKQVVFTLMPLLARPTLLPQRMMGCENERVVWVLLIPFQKSNHHFNGLVILDKNNFECFQVANVYTVNKNLQY